MRVKSCPIEVKAGEANTDDGTGVVEAIVAAYNVDSVGDQIIPGAFAKSLARHAEAGNRIPFVWSHKSDDPECYIGEVLEAEERPEGLWVKARLDIDEPKGQKVYKLLKGRRVSQFSFAYTELDARPASKSSMPGALKELHALDIHECGPTMVGANPNTALLGVKTATKGACPSCGHAPDAKHTDTLPAPAEQVTEQAAEQVTDPPAPEPSAPPAPVDTSLEDRVAALVSAAVEKLLRDRPEAGAADPAAPIDADDEATPAAPAAVQPAADGQPASDREPAGTGTAMNRLRPESDLLVRAELNALDLGEH